MNCSKFSNKYYIHKYTHEAESFYLSKKKELAPKGLASPVTIISLYHSSISACYKGFDDLDKYFTKLINK